MMADPFKYLFKPAHEILSFVKYGKQKNKVLLPMNELI
jgi:hypothetical protein